MLLLVPACRVPRTAERVWAVVEVDGALCRIAGAAYAPSNRTHWTPVRYSPQLPRLKLPRLPAWHCLPVDPRCMTQPPVNPSRDFTQLRCCFYR